MLDLLIDLDGVIEPTDRARAQERLEAEHARLGDPDFLVRHVIGSPGEFEWDFEVLERGFLDLARPFLAEPTGIGGFYVALLRSLGADTDENLAGVLILEYMHLATRINDHFNFHDELSEAKPDFRVTERLVQLRYTAQFLNNYPRYTIRNDVYRASPGARIRLHRWGTQVFTTVGISRACYTRWSHTGFAGVERDAWRQNSIHALCEYVLSPASVASILGGVDGESERAVRRAFSWLNLAIKARAERRVCEGGFPEPSREVEAALLPVTFPYLALPAGRTALAEDDAEGRRFRRVRRVHSEAVDRARAAYGEKTREALRAEEERAMRRFRSEIERAGVFDDVAARIERAFDREAAR